jgi:hypothetical protein
MKHPVNDLEHRNVPPMMHRPKGECEFQIVSERTRASAAVLIWFPWRQTALRSRCLLDREGKDHFGNSCVMVIGTDYDSQPTWKSINKAS